MVTVQSHLKAYLLASVRPPRLPKVYFDRLRGVYYKNGHVVSEARILALGEGYVRDVLRTRVDSATQRMLSGKMSLATWQERVAKDLKDAYIVNLQLGRGGKNATTFSDYGRIGRRLRDEYRYLEGFAQEIKAGTLSDEQIRARIMLYLGGSRSAFYAGRTEAMRDAGYDEERRVLNPAEHCEDCIEYASQGWQPIGFFPDPGMGSRCMHNCRCHKEYRKKKVPAPTTNPVPELDNLYRGEVRRGNADKLDALEKWVREHSTAKKYKKGSMPQAVTGYTFEYRDGVWISWSESCKNGMLVTLDNLEIARANGQTLPEVALNKLEELVFTKQSSRWDSYWKKQFNWPGFYALADAGENTVTVYRGLSLGFDDLAHEVGHQFARTRYGSPAPGVDTAFVKALEIEGPVSEYAGKNLAEAFAEAFSEYCTDPESFKAYYPRQYRVIDKLIKDGIYAG